MPQKNKTTKAELLAIAKKRGVKVAKTWTNAKIMRALNAAVEKKAPKANGNGPTSAAGIIKAGSGWERRPPPRP